MTTARGLSSINKVDFTRGVSSINEVDTLNTFRLRSTLQRRSSLRISHNQGPRVDELNTPPQLLKHRSSASILGKYELTLINATFRLFIVGLNTHT